MATGYLTKGLQKFVGVFNDVSDSTSPVTAREDAIETAGQLARQTLTFSCAETTAAAEASSYRVPLPENGNFELKAADLVLTSGALSAAGYTNYLSVSVKHYADGAATAQTTLATWNTNTDTCSLGTVKSIPLVPAAVLVDGGSLIVEVEKTGTGQTAGITNVSVSLQRRSD